MILELASRSVLYKVKKVHVAWDLGHIGTYRTGSEGKYDLASMDVGTGLPHPLAECNECKATHKGYRWFCTVCDMYDLCDECYNKNKHPLDHRFARFTSPLGSLILAPTRESCANVRLEARGMFIGARVSKDSKHGIVIETPIFRDKQLLGAVGVLWDGEDEPTLHTRNTKDGAMDIKCEEPAKYGLYYKDHLENLGERDYPVVADLASVLMSADQVMEKQEEYGDWVPEMTDSLRQVGIIVAITYEGDCKIRFPALGLEWKFYPQALTAVDEFGVGDTVRLISDEERVKMIQPGHGEWKDEMSQDLGKEGTVLLVQRSGDVKVLINGHPWTLHPACLDLIKADEERPPTEWEEEQELIGQKVIQDVEKQGND